MKVTIDLAAEADIIEASDFYDSQEPGLGAEVEAFLLDCLARLETLAGVHPQNRGVHRYIISRGKFPYFVIYYELLKDSEVLVRVIQDHRRDPTAATEKIEDRFPA